MTNTPISQPKEMMAAAKSFTSFVKENYIIPPITSENRIFLSKEKKLQNEYNQIKSELNKKTAEHVQESVVIKEANIEKLRTTLQEGHLKVTLTKPFANVFLTQIKSLENKVIELQEKIKTLEAENQSSEHKDLQVEKYSMTEENLINTASAPEVEEEEDDPEIVKYIQDLKHNPSDETAKYKLGLKFKKLGKFEKAITQFIEVISFNPNFSEAYNDLGHSYYSIIEADNITNKDLKIGYLKKSATNFKSAIQLNPRFADAYYNLGIVCIKLKLRDEGILNFRKASNLGSEEAGQWLIKIQSLKK